MASLKAGLRQEPRLGIRLQPWIWGGYNLLFTAADSLHEALSAMVEGLPLEVSRRYEPLEYMDISPGTESLDYHIAMQVGECPGLHGKLASAALWSLMTDSRGFLNTSPGAAARIFGVSEPRFMQALRALQDASEPAGIFALDLADCLLIQLKKRGKYPSDAATLITDGRDMLERGRAAEFAARREWQEERLHRAMEELRRLDPSPGGDFFQSMAVIPELEFSCENGHVACRIIGRHMPKISFMDISSGVINEARDVLRRLGMRYRAIIRIGLAVARAQEEYFTGTRTVPAAMSLEAISRDSGLGVSTVSRCLKHTWALSPHGTLLLSSLLTRTCGPLDMHTFGDILRRCRTEGMTDAQVSEYTGIPRRTVAYHRKRLNIP